MGSKQLFMLLYWGGHIINGEHGWCYDMQHRRGIILKEERLRQSHLLGRRRHQLFLRNVLDFP
ncbi:hypothetical protein LguiA_013344 [Lonicera macranthoides]